MDEPRKQAIERRWQEIDAELAAIATGKITPGCGPAEREGELLDEQDALEFELGQDYFGQKPKEPGPGQ